MLNPQHVRETLRNLDVRPTRGMGQNFLIDRDALQTIVSAAHLTQSSVVVEVGPGLGVLTWELVHVAGSVTAIELDTRLANRLARDFRRLTPDAIANIEAALDRLPKERR